MNRVEFLQVAGATGVDIGDEQGRNVWRGSSAGKTKPRGPMAGKTIGILVAPEFSDFQAYHLALYLSEMGARPEFLAVDWVKWKNTRPTLAEKGVQGMWGLSLDPIPTVSAARHGYRPLEDAEPADYDGLVVPGGHSGDILMTAVKALDLLKALADQDRPIGAIGAGILPLIAAEVINGRRCTGNRIVSYMLERIARFASEPVVTDGTLVTARDTADTPRFARSFAQLFDSRFSDPREGLLEGKRVAIIAGEDFEDIELVVPVLEMLYRGARLTLATFPAPLRSRPPLLGLDVVMGNFGVSVPLQEIPESMYDIRPLATLGPQELDIVMIPGAFCPWNMVAAGAPLDWLRETHRAGKPIAAICHGAIPLSAADLVSGRLVAGVGACRDHVTIMGGTYNREWSAVMDGDIVTGRVPSDVPEFPDAMTCTLLPE